MRNLINKINGKFLLYIHQKEWFITLENWVKCNKEFFRLHKQNKIFYRLAENSREVKELETKQPIETNFSEGKLPTTSESKNIKIENNLLECEYNTVKNTIYLPIKVKPTKKKQVINKIYKKPRQVKWTNKNLEKLWREEVGNNRNTEVTD